MKHKRLTPKDAKNIVARATAGDKQKDIARDYGVNPSSISRIVKRHNEKQAKASETTDFSPRRDYSDWTTDKLLNRRRECYREIDEIHTEIYKKKSALETVKAGILRDTKQLEHVKDDGFRKSIEIGITSQKAQLTHLIDTKRSAFSLAVLHQELSGILHALSKRDAWLKIDDIINETVKLADKV